MTDENTQTTDQAATGGLNLSEAMPGAELGEVLLGGQAEDTSARRMREAIPADKHGWWWAVGRRKNAVARVRMKLVAEGSGSFKVQKTRKLFKDIDTYFSETQDRVDAQAPLKAAGVASTMEIVVRVHGGGHTGQAQAIRLGVARALRDYDPTLEDVLRQHGFLTVDARRVERKKYGQPGARKRFQFSKR
jgi:small subunit ribosomal protein S9